MKGADVIARQLLGQGLSPSEADLPAESGVNVIVPTCDDGVTRRNEVFLVALQSLADQREPRLMGEEAFAGPVNVIVVDNGLEPYSAQMIVQKAESLGLPVTIVDATAGRKRSAAHARNVGLDYLRRQMGEEPRFRRPALLFMDDDNVLLPRALDRLARALAACPQAVCAAPQILGVPRIDEEIYSDMGRCSVSEDASPPRPLSGILRDGGSVDLLGMVAYSSDVTAKFTGLLVRQAETLRLIEASGALFVEDTPCGSGEDMLAMAALNRLGQIAAVPGGLVLDLVRETPSQVRRQQYRWGVDHNWLALELSRLGLAPRGLWALVPRADGWYEVEMPAADIAAGYVVNPAEVEHVARVLKSTLPEPGGLVRGLFSAEEVERIRRGIWILEAILARVGAECDRGRARRLGHLPVPLPRGWGELRHGLDSALGRLSGNIVGCLDNVAPGHALPEAFVFGLRQLSSRHSEAAD